MVGRADLRPKTTISAQHAIAGPSPVPLAVGRIDLMMYTVGGSMCALYGHSLPYAARALACVVLAIS